MTAPRVLFLEGMDRYQETLDVNGQALGNLLIKRGIQSEMATAFDVAFSPSKDAKIVTGYYSNTEEGTEVTLATGATVALQRRTVYIYMPPEANLSKTDIKFPLLHETGHAYRDMCGAFSDLGNANYKNPDYVQKVKHVGQASLGAFGAVLVAYLSKGAIDSETYQAIVSYAGVPLGTLGLVGSGAAFKPEQAAWLTCSEEWQANAFALRHWRTDVVASRS